MSPHAPWRPQALVRDRADEQAAYILAMPIGNLLAAAETTDLRALRALAAACRATADHIMVGRPLLGQRTWPVAAMLLRELAARAEHNARAELVSGRQVELRAQPSSAGSTPCRSS